MSFIHSLFKEADLPRLGTDITSSPRKKRTRTQQNDSMVRLQQLGHRLGIFRGCGHRLQEITMASLPGHSHDACLPLLASNRSQCGLALYSLCLRRVKQRLFQCCWFCVRQLVGCVPLVWSNACWLLVDVSGARLVRVVGVEVKQGRLRNPQCCSSALCVNLPLTGLCAPRGGCAREVAVSLTRTSRPH